MQELKPDATGIYVAAHQAAGAIEEAIEAEVPLVVAVAEHIPLHDMLRIHSILKTQSKSRLVGPNSPGIISSIGKCRIGFQPLPCFTPGRVGIAAKSGTLSYEGRCLPCLQAVVLGVLTHTSCSIHHKSRARPEPMRRSRWRYPAGHRSAGSSRRPRA